MLRFLNHSVKDSTLAIIYKQFPIGNDDNKIKYWLHLIDLFFEKALLKYNTLVMRGIVVITCLMLFPILYRRTRSDIK